MSVCLDMLRVKKVFLFIECILVMMYGLWRECLYLKDKYVNELVFGYLVFYCVVCSCFI